MTISDPLEKKVADALTAAGVRFIHGSDPYFPRPEGPHGHCLDFYLPDLDCFIEVTQFHTHRKIEQLRHFPSVILLQGARAVDFFVTLLVPNK